MEGRQRERLMHYVERRICIQRIGLKRLLILRKLYITKLISMVINCIPII